MTEHKKDKVLKYGLRVFDNSPICLKCILFQDSNIKTISQYSTVTDPIGRTEE